MSRNAAAASCGDKVMASPVRGWPRPHVSSKLCISEYSEEAIKSICRIIGTVVRDNAAALRPLTRLAPLALATLAPLRGRGKVQVTLAPENLTTLPHFSVSSATSLPKSAGEPESSVAPSSANRALVLGSARIALTSRLSLAMISAGVPFGAPRPYHEVAS